MDNLFEHLSNEFPNQHLYQDGKHFTMDVNDIPESWFTKNRPILEEKKNIAVLPAKKSDSNQILDLDKQFGANSWKNESSFMKPNHSMYVAKDDSDRIVGYVLIQHKPESNHIVKMLVDQQERESGVGGLLLDHVHETSNIPKMTLNVRAQNTAAKSLYLKHGYVLKKVQKSYYMNGDDAHYMEKEL